MYMIHELTLRRPAKITYIVIFRLGLYVVHELTLSSPLLHVHYKTQTTAHRGDGPGMDSMGGARPGERDAGSGGTYRDTTPHTWGEGVP